jgi:hypothetical protein
MLDIEATGTGNFTVTLGGKACGTTHSSTATGKRQVRSTVIVDSVSTFKYSSVGNTDGREVNVDIASCTGLAYTAAVELGETHDIVQSVFEGFCVTINRVEIV